MSSAKVVAKSQPPKAATTKPEAPLVDEDESDLADGARGGTKTDAKVATWAAGDFQINWLSTAIILVPPMLVIGAFFSGKVPVQWNTMIAAIIFYFYNGFGITVGYHRCFSHRAFTPHPALEWFLAVAGAGAFQGSIKWWGRNHRVHHRYVDTDKDPYNATRGFFYTHVGWMLMKQNYDLLGRVNVSDFKSSPLVRFQHVNYLPIALMSGVFLPTLVCGLGWGDWLGGYFYAALGKMVFVHHSTFFINSIAHTNLFGAKQNFSDAHTSHDSFVCALLSLGEGYHNFHHEFANDYRNGTKWYHWDPSKWFIRAAEMVGLAKDLVRVPNDVIRRNIYNVKYKNHQKEVARLRQKLDEIERKTLDSTVATSVWTWEEFQARVSAGAKLLVIGNYILDLKKVVPSGRGYTHRSKDIVWYDEHPGGKKILDMFVGKDATEAFSGGVYKHHDGAVNLLPHLRVASLKRATE